MGSKLSENIISLLSKRFPKIDSCLDTLRECSVDDHDNCKKEKTENICNVKEYLSNSKAIVLDFDKVKEEYTRSYNCSCKCLCSVDALFEYDDCFYWIEFKNGKIISNETKGIKRKASDSILIFSDISGMKIRDIWSKSVFILVFNYDKNRKRVNDELRNDNNVNEDVSGDSVSLDIIRDHVFGQSKNQFVHFGLGILTGIHFRQVHTYNKSDFDIFCKSNGIE